ncbi:MAG: M23 family metallopeptidase [Treponema sp.]|jgi:hypothetical protein|nr:M23 family metallopeptidase [Treponema sp.]
MAATFFSSFFTGILLSLSVTLFAAQSKPELRGFNEGLFNYHFDRADRELDPSSWMKEARRGLEFALAGWEQTALEFYDDPDLRKEALGNLSNWSEEEMERRYAGWLFRRFFGNQAARMAKTLDGAVEGANRLYAYHTDADGNVIYGETGDPEAVRPREGPGVEADRAAWKDMVSGVGETLLAGYRASLFSAFPELLAYIKEENRPHFEELLGDISALSVLDRRAELEAITAREERLFVARRTGDVWSLRRENENESASSVSSRLIRETEDLCAWGLAALKERIEAAMAGTGDLSLAGEDWLTAFKEQFDRGVKAWTEAEERFIVRRMEWERDSGAGFLAGEEAWKRAFSDLERERLAWEDKSRELFTAGEGLFLNASARLNAAIEEAREEFERDAALRIQGGTEGAAAWVDLYVTCGSVLAEAKNSAAFWLSRFAPGSPERGLEEGTLSPWVLGIMIRGNLSAAQKTAGQELIRWSAIYTQYREKARESLELLEGEFGLALGMDRGALNAVLNADSEDFFLDEYQVELLRTRAIASYWEQRYSIAQAVSSYAEDLSAGRMTEAEGLKQWREAKAGYDGALLSYEQAQERLKAAGTGLQEIHNELRRASEALAAAENTLKDLNSRYALQMAAYRVNSGAFLLTELGGCYASLMEAVENRRRDGAWYTAYLQAELKYAREYVLRDGWSLLESMVNHGDDELVQLKLAFLSAASVSDWYFAAAGMDEVTEEERQSLEEEGLLRRLKRDARQGSGSGRAALLLSLYRELVPYAPGAQKEAAASFLKSLERMFTEYGIEGCSGGILPDAAAAVEVLFRQAEEGGQDAGSAVFSLLLRIDEEAEALPVMLSTELNQWKESLIFYVAAKICYLGIEVRDRPELLMEQYRDLAGWILGQASKGEAVEEDVRTASLYQYRISFLAAHKNLLEAASLAREEGREHWRTYISSPWFDPYNAGGGNPLVAARPGNPEEIPRSAGTVAGSLFWEEGVLADAYEEVEEKRRIAEEAFTLFFAAGPSPGQDLFTAAAGSRLANPGLFWEAPGPGFEFALALESFMEESEKQKGRAVLEESIKASIARYGFEFNHLPPSGQAALEELQFLSAELEKIRVEHHTALNRYNQKAGACVSAGEEYEDLYGEAKQRFTALEKARMEYEKQDAVQRWAGTAYLGRGSGLSGEIRYYREPAEELIHTGERYNRASAALEALKDLYPGDETKRPSKDGAYGALYREYRDSFSKMFLALKARTEFSLKLEAEQMKNRELYDAVSAASANFLNPQVPLCYGDYDPPPVENASWVDFLRITGSGLLGFSFNESSFTLAGTSGESALTIAAYFENKPHTGDGSSQMSVFEQALEGWSARMASYGMGNQKTYQTWGLALDYITRTLIENNPSVASIKNSYTTTDMGADGSIELDGESINDRLKRYGKNKLSSLQRNSWNSLSAQQQADLEFLAVLYLTGGGGLGASGLTFISEYREMDMIYGEADFYEVPVRVFGIRVGTRYRIPYWLDHSELDQVFRVSKNRRNAFSAHINAARELFASELSKTQAVMEAYRQSCGKLAVLAEQREEGITWDHVETVLKQLKVLEASEVETLKDCWKEMLVYNGGPGRGIVYTSVAHALNGLYAWGKGVRDTLEDRFEAAYAAGEDLRKTSQEEYRACLEEYINGGGTLAGLQSAAVKAYGAEAPALKNHLENLGSAVLLDLKKIQADRTVYTEQYRDLAERYKVVIERSYAARFFSELAVREAEWKEQQEDVNSKLAAWREASGLILERGRKDWKDGIESMAASFAKWKEDFKERYGAVDAAWNAAYLESLKNKEAWIGQAAAAANAAMDGALLVLTGSDAEASSRRLDAFMAPSPGGFADTSEIAGLLRDVLNSAGIANLYGAFAAVSGSAEAAPGRVMAGLSGLGVWNAGQARAAARELAQNSVKETARGKMVQLGFQVREAVYRTKAALEESIVKNNKDFDSGMDQMYTMNGGWKRSGNQYIKDIVVHSTLFRSAITDRIILQAYRWFVPDPWEAGTDLSDSALEGLDYTGIQALMSTAQNEVYQRRETLFGKGASGGAFDRWIGEPAETVNGKITNRGSGELGRLLADYYTWSLKQAEGVAAMNAPFWDKPLWDSRNSFFDAPSLRTAADLTMSVVSAVAAAASPLTGGASLVLGAALNLADDALFGVLDVTGGYKSWDEAGFEFGKKALVSAVSSAAGSVFNGFGESLAGSGFFGSGGLTGYIDGTLKEGIGKAVVKGASAGAQALGTGTITSALNAVSYGDGKFGWSGAAFGEGLVNSFISAAAGGTGALTGGTLNLGLEGFYDRYYAGGKQLSALAGSLAGQGITYAAGGDFTLNVFNLGFVDQAAAGAGLLELRLGREGGSAGFGSSGADVSAGTLVGAVRGLEAWKVNFDIWSSGRADAGEYISQMRTLYSGTGADRAFYESVLAGNTLIKRDGDFDGYAKTSLDSGGRKIISLGKEALEDGSRFGLNVILSHEARRNGVDDGELQRLETNSAVAGHVNAALGLMKSYGEGAIGAAMAEEAKTFFNSRLTLMSETAGSREKMDALAQLTGILENYDAGGDYWRFASNGSIYFDGSHNLYDEFGSLLQGDNGAGGFAGSLARVLGISDDEAAGMWTQFRNRGDKSIPIPVSETVRTRYFVQRDYINRVFDRYGGDMALAMTAARQNLYDVKMVYDSKKLTAPVEVFNTLDKFAVVWNEVMNGYAAGPYYRPGLWDASRNVNHAGLFETIKNNWSYTDDNPMYSLIGSGKPIDPIGGLSRTSTLSAYPNDSANPLPGADLFHGSSIGPQENPIRVGLGIDLATYRQNHPLYTTQFETILVQNNPLRWQVKGFGYHLRTSTPDFDIIYGHMTESSASSRLARLISSGIQAGAYTLTLPPGFNIGKAGTTGNSTGEHLHYELRPKF